MLAALEQEFIVDPAGRGFIAEPAGTGDPVRARLNGLMADPTGRGFMADPGQYVLLVLEGRKFAGSVSQLLVRWSLTALIRELEGQIAKFQDAADRASRERTAQALADTQLQLLQTGIDSRIVVNDIVRYADAGGWMYGVLDFTRGPRAPQEEAPSAASLAESLRRGQITDGQRVSRLETELREVLSTSAGLASASENLRLQSVVVRLTVFAIIVAIIAAVGAVIALFNS